jgi:hypothetical protein
MTAVMNPDVTGHPVDNDEERTKAQLWRDARTSIAWGLLVLVLSAAALGVFVMNMPKLQVGMLGSSRSQDLAQRHTCSSAAARTSAQHVLSPPARARDAVTKAWNPMVRWQLMQRLASYICMHEAPQAPR